jgi:DNA polymerase
MGAIEMGLTEAELPSLVKIWRAANKAIVTLWYIVQETAIKAVRYKTSVSTHGVQFYVRNETLWVVLPSGRKLAYIRPGIREDALFYYGMNQTTKQWTRQDTYGGKLVENIVQAIARDILADSMRRVSDAGYSLVMHVHDEIIAETPNGTGSLEEVCKLMSQPLSWAPDMPLAAEGFETDYYRKD